jgi:hypothetical protein
MHGTQHENVLILLKAIGVNNIFHNTLTPFLWHFEKKHLPLRRYWHSSFPFPSSYQPPFTNAPLRLQRDFNEIILCIIFHICMNIFMLYMFHIVDQISIADSLVFAPMFTL